MSNYPIILSKMHTCLYNVFQYFEAVVHPAAGKITKHKKKKRTAAATVIPRATPDSLNIRDVMKKADGFRRNPAP